MMQRWKMSNLKWRMMFGTWTQSLQLKTVLKLLTCVNVRKKTFQGTRIGLPYGMSSSRPTRSLYVLIICKMQFWKILWHHIKEANSIYNWRSAKVLDATQERMWIPLSKIFKCKSSGYSTRSRSHQREKTDQPSPWTQSSQRLWWLMTRPCKPSF